MPLEDHRPSLNPTPQQVGDALRALRERVDMTQEQAAEVASITRQAWQQYETAGKKVMRDMDLQTRLAEAIGLRREDLLREIDRQAGWEPGAAPEPAPRAYELPVLGRVRASPAGPQIYDLGEPEGVVDLSWMFGGSARSLRVAGDSMTGYVESGQLLIYDVGQWPRRNDGCVVELTNGEVYVKEYLETAQGVLKVRQRFPEEVITFPMASVTGVYAVRFRGG